MLDRFVRRLACAVFCCALVACGGGGGGSGSSTPTPPASTTPEPLAPPAAGTLGTVLFADAAQLRPLVDGAKSSFRGKRYASDGSVTTYYTSTIADTANGDGSFSERLQGVFADVDGETDILTIAGGRVQDVFSGLAAYTQLQLRSPVQVNDQYVVWQGTNLDLGDVDGDGKDDFADMLVYARVVGLEDVYLPELGRTVSAVRVDSTALLRATASSTGKTTPIQNAVQSTWYASGLGIVRQQSTLASTSGTGALEFDELLSARDAVTSGLGAAGPTALELPQSLWCCTSAEYVPPALGAAVVGDSALVVGGSNSSTTPGNLTASVLSSRGTLLRAAELPGMDAFTQADPANDFGLQLFGTGDASALLVSVHRSGNAPQMLVELQAMDLTPATVGPAHTIALPTSYARVASAWDGQALWLMWLQSLDITGTQLLLQPYDAAGNALAPAQVLDTTAIGSIGALRASATNGSLLLSWATGSLQGPSYRYALLSGTGATANVHTLGADGRGYTGSIDEIDAPVPVLGDGVAALLWRGPIFSYAGGAVLPETDPRGVLLDAAGQPVRSTSGTLDDEKLPLVWGTPGRPAVAAALGGRLVAAGYRYQQSLDFTLSTPDVLYASFLSPGTSPLATAAPTATSFKAVGGEGNISGLQSAMPGLLLLWPDRALVIGDYGGGTGVMQLWLN